jgi:hypothetical protein
VFTCRFQVFPFVVVRRCDQSAVQQVIVTVRLITGLCLLPQFGLTPKSKRKLAAVDPLDGV